DAVTSLGCVPLKLDEWEIDAVYSCTQKGLSCPPGLSPVSFSDRAVEAINKRKSKVQSGYLDMTLVQHYWDSERFYDHTAQIAMMGHNSRPNGVFQMLGALEQCLLSVGSKITPGAGLAAANKVYAS